MCVLSAAGEILAEEVITNTRECLTAFAARHPAAVFIMETKGATLITPPGSRRDQRSRPTNSTTAKSIAKVGLLVAVLAPGFDVAGRAVVVVAVAIGAGRAFRRAA